MNTKRQTIWLVSMLSLMVVLSAYYLFTQDKDPSDMLTDGSQTEQKEGATEAAGSGTAETSDNGQVVASEVQQGDDGLTDEEILEQISNLPDSSVSSTAVFGEIQSKNEAEYSEQYDSLMKDIANTSEKTAEDSSKALAELNQLEERNEKLDGLQMELEKNFDNAVIDQNDDHYKVVVQSEKLEKSEAVNIIAMVVKALDVPAEQVSVQFVP